MEGYGYQQNPHSSIKKMRVIGGMVNTDKSYDDDKRAYSPNSQKDRSEKNYHKDARLKQWRMIIRNLPFKITREDLQNECSRFGPFTEIVLPPSKKMEGKIAGFAFIQFKTREAAEKAMLHFNENKFHGRHVAADWALNKDTYETTVHEESEQIKKMVKVENNEELKPVVDKGNTRKKVYSEDIKSEEMSDEDELNTEVDSKDISGEDELNTEIDSEDEEIKVSNHTGQKKQNTGRVKLDKAVEEQRVVFLRNLSFETNEDTLKKELANFGEIKLALVCKFQDSGHSKGTAFIHFSTFAEATACLEAVEKGMEIDGREIKASLAIQRDKAVEIEKEKLSKVPTDKRNLRLLRFGLIREGTSASMGMSTDDATKRVRLAEAARKKLENLHMFVSPTRLVFHNLPLNMTDNKLREICKNVAGTNAFIKECRIWRDMNKLDSKGRPKSKGFAFVTFTEHKDALICLQKLNNNPEIFTNEKRPIVEFSVENLAALQAKERRVAHSKGENVSNKQVSERVKEQVKQSIGKIHAAGMKVLPKFFGKKLRHRDMTKSQMKKKTSNKRKNISKISTGIKKSKVVSARKNKKTVTKYLALSS